MAKFNCIADRQLRAIHDRGVVFTIAINDILAADETGNTSKIGSKSRRKNQASLSAEKTGKLLLKLFMKDEIAVEKTRPRAARSIMINCGFGCGNNTGVMCQSQIIIRSDHHPTLAVADYPRSTSLLNRPKKCINPCSLNTFGIFKSLTFGKKIRLAIHIVSCPRHTA